MKTRYSILQFEPGKWLVKGEYWKSCYCDRERFEIVIEQEKRPNKKEVLKSITNPE